MPIYEYECAKCGTFELNQRITEPALRRCPQCKGKVSKLISQTSFQLKGSGWYVTDYSSSKDNGTKKSPAKEEKKSEAPAAKTESADSKPASSGSGKTEATAA